MAALGSGDGYDFSGSATTINVGSEGSLSGDGNGTFLEASFMISIVNDGVISSSGATDWI